MQGDFYYRTLTAVSIDRLEVYRLQGIDDFDVLARYMWNLQLSEALYPGLHLLEIGLRNRLHYSLTRIAGSEHWYDADSIPLLRREHDKIIAATEVLRQRNKPIEPRRVVAELSLGFWISLFNARYHRLWPKIAAQTLPGMPRRQRMQANAMQEFSPLRDLRNRVFHHERIIHKPLEQLHESLHVAIKWISPELHHLALSTDRFQQVFTSGWAGTRHRLMSYSFEEDFVI